jgi:glycosyltransferase involved in cell wall biosynthesis
VMKGAERRVLERASRVICSQGLAERVRQIAPDTPVTEWRFPVSVARPRPSMPRELRRRLRISDKDYVMLYAGNFSRYQGLDLLLDAFQIAARRNGRLRLVCVGASDAQSASSWGDRLHEDVRSRATFLPRVPRREVPGYLEMADALVSLRPAGDNAPLKLFEYMAAGRPILATRGRAHEPVLTRDRAFLCDSNAEDIAAGVAELTRDPARATRVGERARLQAQRHYSQESFEQLLLEVYRDFEPVTLPWDVTPLPPPRAH